MIAVSVSEHGAVSHTPVIPRIAGRTSVNPKRKTIPLNVEMIADDPASPQLLLPDIIDIRNCFHTVSLFQQFFIGTTAVGTAVNNFQFCNFTNWKGHAQVSFPGMTRNLFKAKG